MATPIIGMGVVLLAQRRFHTHSFKRMAYRIGLLGSRMGLVALVALACLAGGVGVLWQTRSQELVIERDAPKEDQVGESAGDADDDAPGTSQDVEAGEALEASRCFVHVDGAVGKPGVVELKGDDLRVFDAVQAAGGLEEDADTSAVNLAEPLADGAKIHIPVQGEEPQELSGVPAAGQAQTSGATGSPGGVTLVNINTASAEELQTLSGIGEATARAIIDERERNGPFASPEDLMRVSGIGEKKFAKVQGDICV